MKRGFTGMEIRCVQESTENWYIICESWKLLNSHTYSLITLVFIIVKYELANRIWLLWRAVYSSGYLYKRNLPVSRRREGPVFLTLLSVLVPIIGGVLYKLFLQRQINHVVPGKLLLFLCQKLRVIVSDIKRAGAQYRNSILLPKQGQLCS